MFTTGQTIFAILFLISFIIIMVIMYRKDIPMHKVYYKNVKWILFGFLLFIIFLFIVKYYMKE